MIPPRTVEDPDPAVPDLPAAGAPLGSIAFPLTATAAADHDPPFTVAGRHAFVVGGGGRGIDEVGIRPFRFSAGPRLQGATARSITITPLGVERRLESAGAPVIERIVVPRQAALCLVEWIATGEPVSASVELICQVEANGAPADLRWRRTETGVLVAGGGDQRALVAFGGPVPLEVTDRDGAGSGVHVRATLRIEPGAAVRMALVGAPDHPALARALKAVGRAGTAIRTRRGHADRIHTDRLALDAPDPRVGQQLEWAKHRLDMYLTDIPTGGRFPVVGYAPLRYTTRDAVAVATAQVATGDTAAARDVLSFLGQHQRESGRVADAWTPAGAARFDDDVATPLYLLLAGRYGRWTGDLRVLRREWPRLIRAAEYCREADLAGRALATWHAALGPLADAAEAIGAAEGARELRAAAESAEVTGAGSAGTEQDAASQTAAPEVGTTGGLFHTEELDTPSGAADDWPRPDRALHTAGVVFRVVDDLLGAEPDAARGRLVLRPRPPADWTRFTVRRLMVGNASVALHYRRDAELHTFRLEQERGAAPLNVVLEPAITGRRLSSASVDGMDAELDPRPMGDRIVVPVQLSLDHARELVVEVNRTMDGDGGQ